MNSKGKPAIVAEPERSYEFLKGRGKGSERNNRERHPYESGRRVPFRCGATFNIIGEGTFSWGRELFQNQVVGYPNQSHVGGHRDLIRECVRLMGKKGLRQVFWYSCNGEVLGGWFKALVAVRKKSTWTGNVLKCSGKKDFRVGAISGC